MTHQDNNAYNPGANWREEAHVRDSATAALGRLGADWAASSPGRTYRWLDDNLYLRDGEAQALRIARTARAEVAMTVADGIARRYPTAQDAITHARVQLGMPHPEPTPAPPPAPAESLCPLALDVQAVCAELVDLIDRKNKAYGNSATQPLAVFSKLGTLARLQVRIDDKLSRLGRGAEEAKAAVPEDTVVDLLGYLLIYLVESRKG